ncbi:MAG: FAD-dependent oxidoreductase [Parcubacteria group bacterium]|nr:FAD-dependent oxidoreductase [Parcubacteria group bacterium]
MKSDITIIGAGAAGLIAARELAKAGKKVIILEAKDRIGGRIFSLDENEFGYQAQGGAEFTHGEVSVTKSLINEAGLTYVSMPEDGEMWIFDGKEMRKGYLINYDPEFLKHREEIDKRLQELNEDMSILSFLNKYFSGERYEKLRNLIGGMVQKFEAANPDKISTFSLREEWLGHGEWKQGRIKEGYGALVGFLESECRKYGAELLFNKEVKSVEIDGDIIHVQCADRSIYDGYKVIVTIPLPVIKQIQFKPAIPEKLEAAEDIGFGQVIKFLIRFKEQWWVDALDKDMSKMVFMLCMGEIDAWWTQYPESYPVLTGWIAGPNADKLKNKTPEEILKLGIASLSDIFKAPEEEIRERVVSYKVVNWPTDPFIRGAYSYSMVGSEKAYKELRKPVNDKIFFAGEAVYKENETATVEGALASGLEVARKILKLIS